MEAPLKEIAAIAGGVYFRADDQNLLENLMSAILQKSSTAEGASRPACVRGCGAAGSPARSGAVR